MQISSRRLAPKETDYELLWLGASVSALVAGVIWFALHLPWPVCIFHEMTGLPCVTCGATRAAIQFLQGHFLAAWIWNPLVFLVICCVAVFDAYALVVLITRAPRLRLIQFSQFEKRALRIAVICMLALNWLYSLGHWRDF
jgi:hypothetical protein